MKKEEKEKSYFNVVASAAKEREIYFHKAYY